jgi:hypothetical protein
MRRARLVSAVRRGYFNVYRVDSRALDLLSRQLFGAVPAIEVGPPRLEIKER